MQEEVKAKFEEAYVSTAIKEMIELAENYDEIELGYDSDGCTVENICEDDEEYEDEDRIIFQGCKWSFNPENIEEYGVSIKKQSDGLFITYPEQYYTGCWGDNMLGWSSAISDALNAVKKAYSPAVQYYGYEGYCMDDRRGSEAVNQEFFSDPSMEKDVYEYVGEKLKELWEDEEFLEHLAEAFEDEIEEDELQGEIDEVIDMVKRYKDYLGDSPLQAMLEYINDEDIIDMIEANM